MLADTNTAIIDTLLKVYIVSVMFAMGLTSSTTQIKEQINLLGLMGKALLANVIIVMLAAANLPVLPRVYLTMTLPPVMNS